MATGGDKFRRVAVSHGRVGAGHNERQLSSMGKGLDAEFGF